MDLWMEKSSWINSLKLLALSCVTDTHLYRKYVGGGGLGWLIVITCVLLFQIRSLCLYLICPSLSFNSWGELHFSIISRLQWSMRMEITAEIYQEARERKNKCYKCGKLFCQVKHFPQTPPSEGKNQLATAI